ncbi:hypothetical protein ACP3P6_22270 [Enterobacter mori]
MTKTLFTLIRDAGRAALYSFVLVPALVLYVFVMLAATDGSLSQQFLTTFHDLTDGVPAGKVMGCVNEHEMAGRFSPPEPGESLKPVPPALAKPRLKCCVSVALWTAIRGRVRQMQRCSTPGLSR